MHWPWNLPDRAFDFCMTRMSNQNHITALCGVATPFRMDSRDQGACGIDHRQSAFGGHILHFAGNAMSAEHRHAPWRHVRKILDKHSPTTA